MASDAAVGFLQGFAGPGSSLDTWAEQQIKQESAAKGRLLRATEERARKAAIIDSSASALADRFAGTEERGDTWKTFKASLIKGANYNVNFLPLIEEDILKKTGVYTFGDQKPKESIQVIQGAPFWRSSPLSQAEKTREEKYNGASLTWDLLSQYKQDNPGVSTADTPVLKILMDHQLNTMGVQGEPTTEERRKAVSEALKNVGYYQEIGQARAKSISASGLIGRDRYSGQVSKIIDPDPAVYDMINQLRSPYSTSIEQQNETPSREQQDETSSISLGDFSGIQQEEINDLISKVRQQENIKGGKFSRESLRTIAKGFVDNPDTTLPSERQEDVLKLLEALLQ